MLKEQKMLRQRWVRINIKICYRGFPRRGVTVEFGQNHSEICSVLDTNIKGIAEDKFQKYSGKVLFSNVQEEFPK
jgi:hypothetical protein